MARFRIRFLFQEFELTGPIVAIGRSPDCHVTIEDPLVSRRHAEIRIDGPHATIVDLGSRNGVRVNGALIAKERALKDGDRIRLGTQELVFNSVRRRNKPTRPTGFMIVCRACATPYPEQDVCPHCGAVNERAPEDDTMSGLLADSRRDWAFQLLSEVIERALATNRASHAERMLAQAAKEIDDRLASEQKLEKEHVESISQSAIRVAGAVGSARWVQWALELHQKLALAPSPAVLDQLESMDTTSVPEMRDAIEAFANWVRDHDKAGSSGELLARLDRLSMRPVPG